MSHITLIIGGARSGKSRIGEELALKTQLDPIYVATAQAGDAEMKARIAHHQASRDAAWSLVEEPLLLAKIIEEQSSPQKVLFVDCLTLWLSNNLLNEANLTDLRQELCHQLKQASGPVILVTNEVGNGIVPAHAMGRDFRDEAGRLNQQVAEIANDVHLIVAGLPLTLKKDGQQICPLGT